MSLAWNGVVQRKLALLDGQVMRRDEIDGASHQTEHGTPPSASPWTPPHVTGVTLKVPLSDLKDIADDEEQGRSRRED